MPKLYKTPKIINLSKKIRKYEQYCYIKESSKYQSYEFFRMGKCQKWIDQRFNNKFLRNIRNNSFLAQNTNEIKFAWYRKNVVIELNLGTKKNTRFPGNPKSIQLG